MAGVRLQRIHEDGLQLLIKYVSDEPNWPGKTENPEGLFTVFSSLAEAGVGTDDVAADSEAHSTRSDLTFEERAELYREAQASRSATSKAITSDDPRSHPVCPFF